LFFPYLTRRHAAVVAAAALVLGLGTVVPAHADHSVNEALNVGEDGRFRATGSWGGNLSGGAEYVIFATRASLVAADTNSRYDVYLKDRVHGTLKRASVRGNGSQAWGRSDAGDVSDDGRYVTFSSRARFTSGDARGSMDTFLKDLDTGGVLRLARDWGQVDLSGNGKYLAFESKAKGYAGESDQDWDVFVYEIASGAVEIVSPPHEATDGNGISWGPSISRDGTRVAFSSSASNLVPGDANGVGDVFVRDLVAQRTERASRQVQGMDPVMDSVYPVISGKGGHVAFNSYTGADGPAYWSAHVMVTDLSSNETEWISRIPGAKSSEYPDEAPACGVSDSGRFVALASPLQLAEDDADDEWDAFVHDRTSNSSYVTSRRSDGSNNRADSWCSALSADGSTVSMVSDGSLTPQDTNGNYDVYVRSPLHLAP
jgi:hypothetical protein